MKKVISLLLCFVMVVSVFAGCGGNKGAEGAGAQDGGQTQNADWDGTITIGLPKSALVTDYYENYYTKWLEEKSGYNIEFQFFAANANDYKTQLNTMIAGKLELPDILWSMNLGQTMYERYGQDGVLVDVSDYFNDPEKSKIFRDQMNHEYITEEVRENTWRRIQCHDGSGAIYVFPEVQESLIDIMDYQVWINQEWLDYLNLEMPHDPQSMYDVLVAFRDKDPNGNGVKDEIPMFGSQNSSPSARVVDWVINTFTYYNYARKWAVDENGKINYATARKDIKDVLRSLKGHGFKAGVEQFFISGYEFLDIFFYANFFPKIRKKYNIGSK